MTTGGNPAQAPAPNPPVAGGPAPAPAPVAQAAPAPAPAPAAAAPAPAPAGAAAPPAGAAAAVPPVVLDPAAAALAATGGVPAEPEVKLDTEEAKRHYLLRLCEKGDLKAVTDMYAKLPVSTLNYKETLKCECTDGTNFTFERSPLLWAVHAKNHRLVSFLIKNGADVNWKVDGEYPLHRAVWGVVCRQDPHMEIAKALLAAGADPNALSDQRGWTPLHYASCETRSYGGIQLLMNAGADPHVPDKAQNFTPLERALSLTREYDYLKESAIMWAERLQFTIRFHRKKLIAHLASLKLFEATPGSPPREPIVDIIAFYLL